MPVECEHGKILDWGDFGGDDPTPEPCATCDNAPKPVGRILWNVRDKDIDVIRLLLQGLGILRGELRSFLAWLEDPEPICDETCGCLTES